MAKEVVTRTEAKYIRARAEQGQTAAQISYALDIKQERVEVFMPKDPKVEKAEAEVKAAARAATKAKEDEDPNKFVLNAAKKKKEHAKIKAEAQRMIEEGEVDPPAEDGDDSD